MHCIDLLPFCSGRQVLTITISGDSYSTTGFDIDGAQPNRSNPIGNPAYPGSTQVGTASFVDYLATRYNQSFIELFNFATGGASIDDTIDPSPYGPAVHSFNHQVQDEFLLKYANGSHTPWTGENSLVAVEFGINDGVMINGRSNGTAIAAQLMKSYEDSLSKVSVLSIHGGLCARPGQCIC